MRLLFVHQCKLELVVGIPGSSMELQLFSTQDKFLLKLEDNDALLGSYPVDDDCRIHVSLNNHPPTLSIVLSKLK